MNGGTQGVSYGKVFELIAYVSSPFFNYRHHVPSTISPSSQTGECSHMVHALAVPSDFIAESSIKRDRLNAGSRSASSAGSPFQSVKSDGSGERCFVHPESRMWVNVQFSSSKLTVLTVSSSACLIKEVDMSRRSV